MTTDGCKHNLVNGGTFYVCTKCNGDFDDLGNPVAAIPGSRYLYPPGDADPDLTVRIANRVLRLPAEFIALYHRDPIVHAVSHLAAQRNLDERGMLLLLVKHLAESRAQAVRLFVEQSARCACGAIHGFRPVSVGFAPIDGPTAVAETAADGGTQETFPPARTPGDPDPTR